MKRLVLLMLVGVFALVLAACPKPEEPGSCFREKDNACSEHSAATAAAGKRLCSGMTWRVGASSCPTENRLGICEKKDGRESLYSGAPNNYSIASAKAVCESGGGTFK